MNDHKKILEQLPEEYKEHLRELRRERIRDWIITVVALTTIAIEIVVLLMR